MQTVCPDIHKVKPATRSMVATCTKEKKLTYQNPGYTCDLTSYQTCKWVKRFPTP